MILARVLDFLDANRVAGLTEIARAVDSTPEAVRSMLQTLQRRGLVHRLEPQAGCGSACRQCAQGSVEIYGHGPQPAQLPGTKACGGQTGGC